MGNVILRCYDIKQSHDHCRTDWTLPRRAWIIPLVYRSTKSHKGPPMKQHAHLPLFSWWHVGQIRLLVGVTGPDQSGTTIVIRALQRHHLTCLDIHLCQGTHACKWVSQILVHFSVSNYNMHWFLGSQNQMTKISLLSLLHCITQKCGWLKPVPLKCRHCACC